MERRRTAGLAAIAAVAVLAVPASAGEPGDTVSLGRVGAIEYLKAVQPGVITQEGPVAACDAEDATTGGGGTISGSPSNAAINRTSPASLGDTWLAQGSTSGISSREVTTYAICGHAEIAYGVAGGMVSPAGQLGDVTGTTQTCTEPETAFAGVEGFGGDVRIVESRPVGPTGWTATVQNHSADSGTWSVKSWCSDAYDVSRRSDSSTVGRGDAGKATVSCDRNEAVINGGLAITANGEPQRDAWAVSTRPWDSSDKKKTPDDGWQVKAYNDSDTRVQLKVSALCAAK